MLVCVYNLSILLHIAMYITLYCISYIRISLVQRARQL